MKIAVNRKFYDSIRLFIKAGSGGNGLPKYGGIGGKGGDVYAEGTKDITLIHTKQHVMQNKKIVSNGESSRQHKIIGDDGNDAIIPVPCGTALHSDHGPLLGDVIEEGDQVLVCRGGNGGHAHNSFIGVKGEAHHIRLYLKLIADIGLVGFPNAGKSTLLRAISKARPKIANYPFTTLHPMIGMMEYEDKRTISMADLPGLIEGAWNNSGMGHKFLRHVERTKMLLFVVDIQGFRLSPLHHYRSALENIILLNKELELYQPDLLDKPCLLLINKMDKPNAKQLYDDLKRHLSNLEEACEALPEEMRPERTIKFDDVILCSAKYDKDSVLEVKESLRKMLDNLYDKMDETQLQELNEKLRSELYEDNLKLL